MLLKFWMKLLGKQQKTSVNLINFTRYNVKQNLVCSLVLKYVFLCRNHLHR